MKYKNVCLLIGLTIGLGIQLRAQQGTANEATISGQILDSSNNKPLPGRIVVTDEQGNVVKSFYQKLPGIFTEPDGKFSLPVKPGLYKVSAYRGIDYVSSSTTVQVGAGKSKEVTFKLKRWYPLKERGWVNGDGHDHLYTDVKRDTLMLDTVKQVCVAQGIDFMCTSQGWAGYNDENWREGYAKFSDDNFLLYYGSEMPKYRTGHTWWLGQVSTEGLFDNTMDTTYENHYYQSEQGTSWTFDSLKFPQIPDVEVVQRLKKFDSGLAVIAHPTSWWWQKRGEIEKYVTNVAAYIPFGLLAGKVWDAQVVMGYNRDHYYYQNLWFNVLNQGYRVTPVSELDGGYNRGDKFYYGSMRTYFNVEGKISMDKIREAVKKGHTFVTSGPIVFARIGNTLQPGDVVPANGKEQTLNIEAYASGEKDDYLSYVVIFRNGKIHKLWDLRKERKRTFNNSLTIKENTNSWYVVKVYGRRAWSDPEMLDVMKYCLKQEANQYDSIGTNSDVAITSPFYFRNSSSADPSPLISQVNASFNIDGLPYSKKLDVEVLVNGEKKASFSVNNGKNSFAMPVHAVLKITVAGNQPVYRSLYTDYTPFRDIIENLASGKWLNQQQVKYNPGEVPWSVFQFDKAKSVLSHVRWNINLEPNERDPLWQPFDNTFKKQATTYNGFKAPVVNE